MRRFARMVRYSARRLWCIQKKIPGLFKYILMTIFSKRLDKFFDKLWIKKKKKNERRNFK